MIRRLICMVFAMVFLAASSAQAAVTGPGLELLFEDPNLVGENLTSTANTGTLGGTATGQAFGDGSLTYTTGPGGFGKASLFTDANPAGGINPHGGRIDAPFPGSLVDWSMTMMVRRDGDQVGNDRLFEMLLGNGTTVADPGPRAIFSDADTLRISLGWRNHDIDLADGLWTHLAMTYDHDGGATDRALGKVYVDGVYVPTGLDGSTYRYDYTTVTDLVFGVQASNNYRPLGGALDSIKVFGSALSATEVEAEYQAAWLPEPATLGVLCAGGLLLLRRRRR